MKEMTYLLYVGYKKKKKNVTRINTEESILRACFFTCLEKELSMIITTLSAIKDTTLIVNRIGGVMVSGLASSAVERRFEPR